MINSISSPIPLIGGQGVWLKFPSFNHALVFLVSNPHFEAILGPQPSITSSSYKTVSHHFRDSKSFRSGVPGARDKDQIYIYHKSLIDFPPLPL